MAPDRPSQFVITLGGLVGNVLEWYDFAVYGALAEDIGRAFFSDGCHSSSATRAIDGHTIDPTNNGNSGILNITNSTGDSSCGDDQLIESFAVFGGAFLMRPIGAALFGYIGDKVGRKKALELSVLMMCFATVIMGSLPTKAQAGIAAPILLCIVRLFQGVSVGGELVGSIVYTTEMAPFGQEGVYACLSLMTAALGTTLGMGVGAIMHASFSDEELSDWAWRIPFVSGIFLGVFAVWIRRRLPESEDFEDMKEGGELSKHPLKDAVTMYKWETLTVFFTVNLWAAGFYMMNIWMRLYMTNYVDPPIDNANGITAGCMVFLCIVFPVMGYTSDRVQSRKLVMLFGGFGSIILSIPLFLLVNAGQGTSIFAIMIWEILLSSWGAPMCAWMVEAFPVSARYSAVAIGYNSAHAVTGGTALLLATYLTDEYGYLSPAVMFMVIATLSTSALIFGKTAGYASTNKATLSCGIM